jgi:hypothetical protein
MQAQAVLGGKANVLRAFRRLATRDDEQRLFLENAHYVIEKAEAQENVESIKRQRQGENQAEDGS